MHFSNVKKTRRSAIFDAIFRSFSSGNVQPDRTSLDPHVWSITRPDARWRRPPRLRSVGKRWWPSRCDKTQNTMGINHSTQSGVLMFVTLFHLFVYFLLSRKASFFYGLCLFETVAFERVSFRVCVFWVVCLARVFRCRIESFAFQISLNIFRFKIDWSSFVLMH